MRFEAELAELVGSAELDGFGGLAEFRVSGASQVNGDSHASRGGGELAELAELDWLAEVDKSAEL